MSDGGTDGAALDAALARFLSPADPADPAAHGRTIDDARGGGRWVRVTWHHEAEVVVLSLWRDDTCVGTARLARTDVPLMVHALVDGLADEPATPGRRRRAPEPPTR